MLSLEVVPMAGVYISHVIVQPVKNQSSQPYSVVVHILLPSCLGWRTVLANVYKSGHGEKAQTHYNQASWEATDSQNDFGFLITAMCSTYTHACTRLSRHAYVHKIRPYDWSLQALEQKVNLAKLSSKKGRQIIGPVTGALGSQAGPWVTDLLDAREAM
ncbi:hypothetical protein VNO77_19509 [Canavalia gladiata]|uniref:Uncharacterized protein n=1 Tax=Canavalia gladiata TaxID=3824 RepID=A0AAN9LML7_CANGL